MTRQITGISLLLWSVHVFLGWGVPTHKTWVQLRPTALSVDVLAEGISSLQFQVFDLSGRRIFHSGTVQGATYKWYFNRNDKQFSANGVYLYIITMQLEKKSYSVAGKVSVIR